MTVVIARGELRDEFVEELPDTWTHELERARRWERMTDAHKAWDIWPADATTVEVDP